MSVIAENPCTMKNDSNHLKSYFVVFNKDIEIGDKYMFISERSLQVEKRNLILTFDQIQQ